MFKKISLSLFFVFFLISSGLAQPEGLQQIRINDFSGGMVSNSIADILKPNQGASMVNVVLTKSGIISKRKGQDLFNQDVGNTAHTGIGRFDPDATSSYLLIASGPDILRAQVNDVSWASVTSAASRLTTGKNTEFVQANDLMFILNGFDPTAWHDGSTFTKAGDYPSSPPTATTGAWLRNYLFLGGATTENDWIYISDNLSPKTFTDADDVIKINTGDGQKIQKLEPYRENELIVYKERSIFVLDITGDPPSTCTTNCWTVQPLSTVIGTIAPRSVVSLGNDQWFLSSEPIAIRSLARTSFDKILVNMVSQPIQDIFDGNGSLAINENQISKAAAILFDNKYFLAIPTGSSTVNNTVLVFDFLVNAWYIIDNWFPEDWIIFDDRLFYADANDGRVIECFASTYADWEPGPGYIDLASSPSIITDFEHISKDYDFDYPENWKELDAIEVEFDPTGNYNADVMINLDNEGWSSVATVNLSGQSTTLSLTLPSTLMNSGVARKTVQFSENNEFKKMKVRIRQAGLNEKVNLQRITIFSRIKPWDREQEQ